MAQATTIKQAYGRALAIIGTFALAGGLLAISGFAAASHRTDSPGTVPISEFSFDESNRVEMSLKRGLVYCVPEPIILRADGKLINSDDETASYNCYKANVSGVAQVTFENVNSSSKHSLVVK